jgi:hypothetical protein
MDEKTHEDADNLVDVPTPNPPSGGPNADPGTPDPADLVPGLGGMTQSRPDPHEDDA